MSFSSFAQGAAFGVFLMIAALLLAGSSASVSLDCPDSFDAAQCEQFEELREERGCYDAWDDAAELACVRGLAREIGGRS